MSYFPTSLFSASGVIIPSWLTFVSYYATNKIIDVARKRFGWNENACLLFSLSCGTLVGSFLSGRVEPYIFEDKNRVTAMSFYFEVATVILIACVNFSSMGGPTDLHGLVTNLSKENSVKKFTPLGSQDKQIELIEQSFHREAGKRSLLLVGDYGLINLLIQECTGRVANRLLSPNSPLQGKNIYSVDAAVSMLCILKI